MVVGNKQMPIITNKKEQLAMQCKQIYNSYNIPDDERNISK